MDDDGHLIPEDAPHFTEYKSARTKAAERHNRELRLHAAYPQSWGYGIGVICACGQKFNIDGWRDHLITTCMETPISHV